MDPCDHTTEKSMTQEQKVTGLLNLLDEIIRLDSERTRGPWNVLPEEQDKEYLRLRGTRLGGRYKIANVHAPKPKDLDEGWEAKEREESWANVFFIAWATMVMGQTAQALKRAIHALQEIAAGDTSQLASPSQCATVADAMIALERITKHYPEDILRSYVKEDGQG